MFNREMVLPKKESFFLFGPRQVGKSTLVKESFKTNVWEINLLLNEIFLPYSKDPSLFRKEAVHKLKDERIKIIFVDEVQRLPELLNEIQYLMQEVKCQFILTGSSARKLKRGSANLLGGRAVERFLFPLTSSELKEKFSLDHVLLYGSLPPVINKTNKEKVDLLSTYVNTYLKEEIQSEGIVRNIGGFSRFLDVACSQFGELTSFSEISRECQVPVRTVQSYYEILEDTLIGFKLEPWRKSIRKRLSGHPKFYFFDNGIINAVCKRLTATPDQVLKRKLFEHWIIQETYRTIKYKQSEANIFYWRTNNGAEVDLLLEKHGKLKAAFEIKFGSNISGSHLSGIRAFKEDYPSVPCYVISNVKNAYEIQKVKIIPWRSYLDLIEEVV